MGTTPDELLYSTVTRIVGQGEDYAVDVVPRTDGKKAICVDKGAGQLDSLSSKLRLDWSETQVSLPLTNTAIYTYSGSGYFEGFTINFNTDVDVALTITVDSVNILTDLPLSFLKNMYGGKFGSSFFFYIGPVDTGVIQFDSHYPIKFNTNVTVYAKGLKNGKTMDRYIVAIQKDT